MIWLIVGGLLGFVIGYESQHKSPTVDYTNVNEKLLNELTVAQTLNQSLLADKSELQQQLWKLKNANKDKQ